MKITNDNGSIEYYTFPLFANSNELDDRNMRRLPLELYLQHEGHEIIIDNQPYIMNINRGRPDIMKLVITQLGGTSPDSMHTYGHLRFPSFQLRIPGTNNILAWQDICDVLSSLGLHIPRKIMLHRALEEINFLRYPERYKNYDVGGSSNGFDTVDDLVEQAKFVVKTYLPGFRLYIPKDYKAMCLKP